MNPEILKLYYPSRPYVLNQGFGANSEYYSKFHDSNGNPLKGHDGLDFHAPHGTPVFAAHDGMIHFEKDAHGGEGMAIHTPLENGVAYITMYWHLIGDTDPKFPSPLPLDGTPRPVTTGTLIGFADNTGAPYESSGDHLHFGLFRVDAYENTLEINNGFNGRIDPTPFFTGIYAEDVQSSAGFHYTFTKQLTFQGAANDATELRALQTALQTVKRPSTGVSYMQRGVYGPFGVQTRAALGLFQTDHNIKDAGGQGNDFGPQSRAALNAALLA